MRLWNVLVGLGLLTSTASSIDVDVESPGSSATAIFTDLV